MSIRRYSLDVTEVDHAIVTTSQEIRRCKSGNIVFVIDLIRVMMANMPLNRPMSSYDKGVYDTLNSILNALDA